MKKNIVAYMAMALMIMAGAAAPAFSFDFIKLFDQYAKKTVFPEGTPLSVKRNQFGIDLSQNRTDFINTHPGTTDTDFADARRIALRCNLPGSRMAYVTDGHQGTYHPKVLHTVLSGGWEYDGFTNCGSGVLHNVQKGVVIDGSIGSHIIVDIIEDLTTGTFRGRVDITDNAFQLFDNVTSLDDMLSLVTVAANTQLNTDDIIVSRAGITQIDPDLDEGLWMKKVATILGLQSTEWRRGECISVNRMFIDYTLDVNGYLDHAFFTIIKRADDTYELYEHDTLEAIYDSSLDVANTLSNYRG